MSVCMKILSDDKISTRLGDILFYLYIIVSSNPKRFPILSLITKPISGPCGFFSIILPRKLKYGLI